jgi:hypothetical protein
MSLEPATTTIGNTILNRLEAPVTEWRGRTMNRCCAMQIIFAICAIASIIFSGIVLIACENPRKSQMIAVLALFWFLLCAGATAITTALEDFRRDENEI